MYQSETILESAEQAAAIGTAIEPKDLCTGRGKYSHQHRENKACNQPETSLGVGEI